MSDPVIKVQNLGKLYRLGEVGTGSIADDLKRWWANVRGREDPFSTVGTVNDRTSKDGESDYVWALKDINFEVKKGEVLGIIGRNGAGKSTLLKLLSRITAPSTGSISIRGRVASLLEVGTGFNPELTGKENVYLNGTILGMTKREVDSRYEEIMEFAGCTRYADTPVKRYSSGMKVRLGFAVAAFLEPEILIVDEVLAVGDAEFQQKAIGKMQDVSKEGKRTVLFVSHNMTSVKSLCSRCILLNNGTVVINGDTEYTVNEYLKLGKDEAISFKERTLSSDQPFIFTGWEVVDKKLGNGTRVRSKSNFIVRISYLANLNLDFGKIYVAFVICDIYGQVIATAHSEYSGKSYQLNDREGQFECEIKNLPLTGGEYSIMLFCKSSKFGNLDKIENSGLLTVEEIDVYNVGKQTKSKHGIISLDQDWK